jgi:hypothetical protein
METAILGRRLHGEVEPEVAAWVASRLAEPTSAATGPAVALSAFAVELTSESGAIPATILERDAYDAPLGTRHLALDDDEFWVLERVAQTDQGVRGRIFADGAALTTVGSPFAAWGALRQAVHEVLAASGIIWLHASAARVGPATAAFVGPRGRGKSTTLVRAAASGWTPLAEDAAFVDVDTLAIVRADGHDHVRLRPGFAESGVSIPTAATPRPGSDGRLEVAFAELGGGVSSARLTHLVRLVRGTASKPAWSRLSRTDAVMALHEAVGVPTTRRVGRLLGAAFGDIVTRVETLTLDLGSPQVPLPALPHA